MNKELKRPITESYWVEPGRFLAGEYPGKFNIEETRQRVNALLEAGFTTFIDLTKPNETVPYIRVLLEQAKYYDVEVAHRILLCYRTTKRSARYGWNKPLH